jgi:hypothetical protein
MFRPDSLKSRYYRREVDASEQEADAFSTQQIEKDFPGLMSQQN